MRMESTVVTALTTTDQRQMMLGRRCARVKWQAALEDPQRTDSHAHRIARLVSLESGSGAENREVKEGGVSAVLRVAQSLLGPYVGSDELGCWATAAARYRIKERV